MSKRESARLVEEADRLLDQAAQLEGLSVAPLTSFRSRSIPGFRTSPAAQPFRPAPTMRPAGYELAFRSYISGAQLTDAESGLLEQRDLSEGVGSAGGYLVSQSFFARLQRALKWSSAMVSVANVVFTPTGRQLPFPATDDSAASAGSEAEGAVISSASVPAFTQGVLGAFTFGTGLLWRVSRQLEADSGIDIEQTVADMFAARIANALDPLLFSGSGGGTQPKGILNGTPAATITMPTGHTTTLDFPTLAKAYTALDAVYRARGSWLCNSTTLGLLLGLVGTDGLPIVRQPAANEPLSLFGRPIVPAESMSSPAASNVTLLFGDFTAAYIVRIVEGDTVVKRLTERFADSAQVGYTGFLRADGQPAIGRAYVAVQQSAV
jgi:HK97 family phage major capsid protein